MDDETTAKTLARAHMKAALARFGLECGPEFWKRYHTDPWVFNLANAVRKLTDENTRLRARDTA